MPWNLFILNLVAGYFLLTKSYLFKFKQQRLDTQRLVFESVLLGVVLTFLAYVVNVLFQHFLPETYARCYAMLPSKTPFFGTSLITFFLAIILVYGGNLFLDKNKYIQKAIEEVGNEFELLLKSAMNNNTLIQLTLDNRKFYIGWVKEMPIPSVSNYIRIIPAVSGYRNESLEMVFTAHYLSVYSKYVDEGKINKIEDLEMDLVINVQRVINISNFDAEVFERFNS